MNMKLQCPFCEHEFEDEPVDGSAQCPSCHEFFNIEPSNEPDDSMDGDAASALASAGMGTDEDYEHHLCDETPLGEMYEGE